MSSLALSLLRQPRPDLQLRALFFALVLLTASGASADALAREGSHIGEDHSFEVHADEDLREIDLSGADLSGSDLSGSDLKDAVLVEAVLVGTDLSVASLKNADLTGADLRGAWLEDTAAKNATFVGAVLNGASLVGADLKNTDFAAASLLGADLSDLAKVKNASFDGAFYDADTALDPRIDTSGMIEVVGPHPEIAGAMLVIDDGESDYVNVEFLPEPSPLAALVCGGALLLLPRRRA